MIIFCLVIYVNLKKKVVLNHSIRIDALKGHFIVVVRV